MRYNNGRHVYKQDLYVNISSPRRFASWPNQFELVLFYFYVKIQVFLNVHVAQAVYPVCEYDLYVGTVW